VLQTWLEGKKGLRRAGRLTPSSARHAEIPNLEMTLDGAKREPAAPSGAGSRNEKNFSASRQYSVVPSGEGDDADAVRLVRFEQEPRCAQVVFGQERLGAVARVAAEARGRVSVPPIPT